MASHHEEIEKKGLDRTAKLGISIALVILLLVPAVALISSFQNDENPDLDYIDETGSATGDMSMDESSREAWENYLDSAPSLEYTLSGPNNSIMELDPDIEYEIPDLNGTDVQFRENDDNTQKGDDGSYAGGGNADDRAEEPSTDQEGDNGGEREVEESDIVKVIGNRMYVLNNYRGLVVVNIEDTEDIYVEGSVQVLGHPISMYVVDFLGFVIVGNAPSLDGTGYHSGAMYIIDLMDNSEPRIVQMVELTGYPVDSRRVGQVIYVISNDYDYYYWGWNWGGVRGGMMEVDTAMDAGTDESMQIASEEKEGPKTHVTSVAFTDPLNIGEKDNVEISGNAGLIHASPFAIYVPQPNYDYADPETRFVYVDISDPLGDIIVRDDISIPGLLMDRYQMDHYKGTFRVVTQTWPSDDWWSELPMSTLYVIDARDPDELKRVSKLLIDDSGNLMATRFEGDRAYTIHLPRTIDPLDVIDLSDPADPKLTDILELPGWVEHMEVIGYNIIAVGVDDQSDSGWKVSLSLFDVSDASNAVLKERIIIGEGHTYSSANYDPKALTILEDQGLVLIPYNSYDWRGYYGSENAVQIASFDLDEGTLAKRGKIDSPDNVERTRWVNGAVVTMSQRKVQTIDVEDLDLPEVLDSVDITANVVDAFYSSGTLVSLVQPFWDESGGRIRVHASDDPDRIVAEYGPSGLDFVQVRRDGNMVFFKGIRQGVGMVPVSEVHVYDMTDPADPVHMTAAAIPVPESDYYYEKYYEEDRKEEGFDENLTVQDEEPAARIGYDPFNWEILDDGSVLLFKWNYNYYNNNYRSSMYLSLVSWGDDGSSSVVSDELYLKDYSQRIVGNSDELVIATQSYWPPVTNLYRVVIGDDGMNATILDSITGGFIGASEDLSKVYTRATFYQNETVHYNLNVYGLGDDEATLIQSVNVGSPTSDVSFNGDSIVVVSNSWDRWWGGYSYPEDDIVYDEEPVEYDEGSSDEKASSSEDSRIPYEEPRGTEIILFDLENGLFSSSTSMELEENVYASLITQEFIIVNNEMTHTVVSIVDGLKELVTWFGNGWAQGGDLTDSKVILALGMYGLDIMAL